MADGYAAEGYLAVAPALAGAGCGSATWDVAQPDSRERASDAAASAQNRVAMDGFWKKFTGVSETVEYACRRSEFGQRIPKLGHFNLGYLCHSPL